MKGFAAYFPKVLFFLIVFCLAGATVAAANPVFLFVPHDNRPVSAGTVKDTVTEVGVELRMPEDGLLTSRYSSGKPDAVWQWVFAQAGQADALVLSADTLLYGGLVPSRTHHESTDVLKARLANFAKLRQAYPELPIYVFSTVMRSPQLSYGGVEPPYYDQYGGLIFRLGALLDKQETDGLTAAEQQELAALPPKIPAEFLADWQTRRSQNLEMNIAMLELARSGILSYYVQGRDDSWPYSQSRREVRVLKERAKDLTAERFVTFSGADQLGGLLVARAWNHYTNQMPFIYDEYAPGSGAASVPSYQYGTTGETVRSQIWAARGYPTASFRYADFVLALDTPFNGHTPESASPLNTMTARPGEQVLLSKMGDYLSAGKKVAVADIAFANGSNNAFMEQVAQAGLLPRLLAYAGWNTASNSSGYAIFQGMFSLSMPETAKNRLLAVRYLDEWAYQANVRQQVVRDLLVPRSISTVALGEYRPSLQEETTERLRQFANQHMQGFPLPGFTAVYPWDRMFEIKIMLQ